MKRASKEYEQFRLDLSNGYMSRSREMLFDITKADRQISNFKLVHTFKKKSKEIK